VSTSLASVKNAFAASGITIREWSQANGFGESLVYAVLNGKNKASRGESFKIAVALGLKTRPDIDQTPAFLHSVLVHPLGRMTSGAAPNASCL
jgi:gp16 family phage-associated protein